MKIIMRETTAVGDYPVFTMTVSDSVGTVATGRNTSRSDTEGDDR